MKADQAEFRLGRFIPEQPVLRGFAEHAHLTFPVANLSDRAICVRLIGEDAGQECRFELAASGEPAALVRQIELRLDPAAIADVTVRITPLRRRLIGMAPREHRCTIRASGLEPYPLAVGGVREYGARSVLVRMRTVPLVGLPALALALAACLCMLVLWLRPGLEQLRWQPLPPQWGVPGGARVDAQPVVVRAARLRDVVPDAVEPDQALTYERMFQEIAGQYGLDWRLLAQLAYEESRLNPAAVGGRGEQGLMQIMPATWDRFAGEVGVTDAFDPYSNVTVAAAYLVHLREYLTGWGYPEDYWMLAAYNWGPDNLHRMLIAGGGWTGVPARTQNYALRILQAVGSGDLSPSATELMQTSTSSDVRVSRLPATD